MSIAEELRPIFYPRGVAVVGASEKAGNLGRFFLEGLLHMGLPELYPVHPHQKEILGLTAYPSIKDIPYPIDLAVLASPRETIAQIVSDCAARSVRGVVIFTGGFGEKDEEGRLQERKLVSIARKGGTRLIGPNCQGIYCPASRLAHFPGLSLESGKVGMISHSGSLSAMTAMAGIGLGIRFSKVVSCGNECDLNAADFLEYLGQDPETEIIIAYLEGMKDGQRFYRLARQISPQKPILLWKGGITPRGSRAAASHTGALAGSSQVWQAFMAQCGIIPVNSTEELLDYLLAFYYLPLPRGNRVAIVSGPGGPAVGTTDACIEAGLDMAELSSHVRHRIAQMIPPVGTSTDNPIDLGMASGFFPEWYRESIKALDEDESVDMILVIGGRGNGFAEMLPRTSKPLVVAKMPRPGAESEPIDVLGLPIYPDGRRAALALGRLARYARFREDYTA